MAAEHRSAERFLVMRLSFNLDDSDDFIEVTEHTTCVEALQFARSWFRHDQKLRQAEVWVGDFRVYDSDKESEFALSAKHRQTLAPVAPGRYGYDWIGPGVEYRFVLIKRGLGQ